jgi:type I restriction enzyme R subunit
LLVSSFEDPDLHKKYNFVNYLVSYLNVRGGGDGFTIDDKIKAEHFVQKNTGTHKQKIKAAPDVKLAMTSIKLTDDEEKKLSIHMQ